jgi:arylsulfatase A-like enzyme
MIFRPCLLLCLASILSLTSIVSAKPNIIVILTDDMGSGDLGVYGGRDIPTPNIDALAASGVRFTQAYSNGSFCTPTRAALMGCRYQHRFGVEDLAGRDNANALPTQVITLPERLRAAGYRTGFVGKWHLGEDAGLKPADQGFDEVMEASMLLHDRSSDRTEQQSALAALFLEKHRDDAQPFFLYLAYNAVHVPVAAPEEYRERFTSIVDEKRRLYAAMLSCLDDGLGSVLKTLKETEKLDNTLVVFTNDNGGPTTRNGTNGSTNTPLRGSKCETFEGGIRVPMMISWPGIIPPGITYDRPVITFDVSATVIAAATGDATNIDGVDLVPFVKGVRKGVPHETLFWRSRTMNNNYAVRQGDWKYVVSTFHEFAPEGTDRTYAKDPPSKITPSREMLFNLASDAGEQVDLAQQNPTKLAELRKLFESWSDEVDADCRKLGFQPKFAKEATESQSKTKKLRK